MRSLHEANTSSGIHVAVPVLEDDDVEDRNPGTNLDEPLSYSSATKSLEALTSTLSMQELGETDEILLTQKNDVNDTLEDMLLKGAGTHIKYRMYLLVGSMRP